MHSQVKPMLALVLACGCMADEGSFDLVYESDRFDVYTADGLEVCGGSIDYMERHADLLEQLAMERGVPLHGQVIEYTWLSEEEFESRDCLATWAGCAFGRKVTSLRIPYVHEVTHAIFSGYELRNQYLEEGLATVFGDDATTSSKVEADVEDFFRGEEVGAEDYPAAADFVRLLLEHYSGSLAAIVETTREASFEDAVTVFAGHGVDLQMAVEEFEARPSACPTASNRIPLVECSLEPIPWEKPGELWRVSAPTACSDPGTMNTTPGGNF